MSGTYHNRRPARGLTLIELVVVVAVLTLLGGLVVQTLPNLMKRTHLSKCADTITTARGFCSDEPRSTRNRCAGVSISASMGEPCDRK